MCKENWATISELIVILNHIRSQNEYLQSSTEIVEVVGPTKIKDNTIYALNYRAHGYAVAKFGKKFYITDGNNLCRKPWVRANIGRTFKVTLKSIVYETETKLDFCSSALGCIIFEFIRLMKQPVHKPSEVRPSPYLRRLLQSRLHKQPEVSRLVERTISIAELRNARKQKCNRCSRNVLKRFLHLHLLTCQARASP